MPGLAHSARFVSVLLLATACAAALPSVDVVAKLGGGDFAPVAAGAGFVVTGSPLTVWRPRQLQARRSAPEHPGAIAVAPDGRACATVAAPPSLGLRSYRLPQLEPIRAVGEACNDRVEISRDGTLVACAERRVDQDTLRTIVRVFTFPELLPVQSWGPIAESVEALSFVGAQGDKLAVVVSFLEPGQGADGYRSRLDLYDSRKGRIVADFSRKGLVPRLAFAARGDIFVWAGRAGAELWSARSFAPLRTFDGTEDTIAVALSPDARVLATSRGERTPGAPGGGAIQIFATEGGARLAAFGSAELRDAALPHDGDQMLNERAPLEVRFELLGRAKTRDSRAELASAFGSPARAASQPALAFVDDTTLVSAGRGFFALWTLNQEAIRRLRPPP